MNAKILTVENLAAGYGRIPVLFGISFTVAEGESIGILGHNGMGKTTLLRTIVGHLPATAGSVRLGGVDVTGEPTHVRARRGIGYVPQGRQIFPTLTVLENLTMGAVGVTAAETRARVDAVLEDFPRLKPLLDRQGGVLSGGEQQILALARCLCGKPRLLLLDEPTEGIQPSIIDEIAESLQRLARRSDVALLLVEQNLDFIRRLSGRVLMIRKGVLSDEINPSALINREIVNEFVGLGV
jgi:urea ABC transporter ATP-binding protein UrtE